MVGLRNAGFEAFTAVDVSEDCLLLIRNPTSTELTTCMEGPVKRWQKTALLGAAFGTLSTTLQPTPGRFNLFLDPRAKRPR